MEVLNVMELLDGFQIGLWGFDLGSQIFSNFLNRFVAREEVENLVDIMTKYVTAPELLNQPGLEAGPVVDVVERPSLI